MTAGDSWEDLHGTKDRPPKEFEREEQRLKYEALLAEQAAASGGAGPSSDGAGPSSVAIDINTLDIEVAEDDDATLAA